jgi:hypothetical protein
VGNKNARIDDLAAKIDRLSVYVDAHFDELESDRIKALIALHGQLSSRLGRLKRDQRQLTGGEGDELADAIHQSLVVLSEAWGGTCYRYTNRWNRRAGYVVELGRARGLFFSAAPHSNVVGATADLLLECDEAQDVRPDQ